MKTRLYKEVRALLPVWATAVGLVFLAAWLGLWDRSGLLGTAALALAAVLLPVAMFGQEFAQGTFLLTFSQPISRARLWWEKTLVLLAALLLLGLLHVVLGLLPGAAPSEHRLGEGTFGLVWLLFFIFWGSGVWLSVTLRQPGAAIWLALVIPMAWTVVLSFALMRWGGASHGKLVWALTAVLYGAGTLVLAYRGLQRWEDFNWLNREISLPWRRAGELGETVSGRRRSGWRNLWVKEVRLQQMNFVFIGLVLLLFAAQYFLSLAGAKITSLADRQGFEEFCSQFLTLTGVLWALIPLLVGAVAVAEERKLGTQEWHLTLPLPARRQWLVKVALVVGLSLLLDGLIPWLLACATDFKLSKITVTNGPPFWPALHGRVFLISFGGALVLSTVAFYASSVTRSFLQALSLTLGLLLAGSGIYAGVAWIDRSIPRVGPLHLFVAISLPVILLWLWPLSYRNFHRELQGTGAARRNLLWLLAGCALVGGLTWGGYARAWEVLLPEAGTSTAVDRIQGPVAPKIVVSRSRLGSQVYCLLPNGTLWGMSGSLSNPVPDETLRLSASSSNQPHRVGGSSRWRDVAATYSRAYAVRDDGTLWEWGRPIHPASGKGREVYEPPHRVTEAHDWASVAGSYDHALALKTNGTLWAWGWNEVGQLGIGSVIYQSKPQQVGTNRDWMEIKAAYGRSVALKRDGTLWVWGKPFAQSSRKSNDWLRPDQLQPGSRWRQVAVSGAGGRVIAIRKDQTIWLWPSSPSSSPVRPTGVPGSKEEPVAVFTPPIQLKMPSHWTAVADHFSWFVWFTQQGEPHRAVGGPNALAISVDGRLALWYATDQFRLQKEHYQLDIAPEAISGRTDWVAVAQDDPFAPAYFGLTADGALWTWGMDFRATDRQTPYWMPPTHRPHLVARLH